MLLSSINFEPLIPPSLFAFIAVAGAVVLALYAFGRRSAASRARWAAIVSMMAVGFLIVLIVLLNPILVRPLPGPPGKPMLTVLIDSSASMATNDCNDGRTRYIAAAQIASSVASRLKDDFEVRVRSFADAPAAADAASLAANTPTGRLTDLTAAIGGSLDQDHPQGQAIVLLSDGINNVGTSARVLETVHLAKAMATPLYTRSLGGEVNTFDVSVELRSPQDLAFIGQKVPVTVRLRETGTRVASAVVRLVRGGEEVARREVQLSPVSDNQLLFMVSQDKIGLYPYEVRVDPLAGEVTSANNSAAYLLRVVDEPIRVLVVEGKPYWDSKFLLRTLSSDPAVALDSVVKISDTRYVRRTVSRGADNQTPSTSPVRNESWKVQPDAKDLLESGEQLKGYQVVILGCDAEAFLTDAAVSALQNWIAQDGGALVCYRGSPTAQVNQKIARLLPVKWTPTAETRFRVKLTDPGRSMNWWPTPSGDGGATLSALPTLVSAAHVESSKPLAVVLATSTASGDSRSGNDMPAVVYQQYGTGRVVVIEGAGMWRWAFLPPQYQQDEEIYRQLWQSVLRWLSSGNESLAPGRQMMLRADKAMFMSNEPATATLLVREQATRKSELPGIELALSDADASQPPKVYQPAAIGGEIGTYRLNFGSLPEGRYTARIIGAKADDSSALAVLTVRNLSDEQLDLRARDDLMQRIAEDSGGATLKSSDAAAELAQQFREHLARAHPTQVERVPAWDRWWLLAAVIGVWMLSWVTRRSSGLI